MNGSMSLPLNPAVLITLKLTSLVCLLILNTRIKWKNEFPAWASLFFSGLILWGLVTIVRGLFLAKNYWDWKYLIQNTGFAFLVPYAVIAGALYNYCDSLFKLIVTKLFVFGFLVIPLTIKIDIQREFFPRGIAITCSFFVLIIPYVKDKWRFVITCVALTAVFIALDYRANIIRMTFAFLMVAMFYSRKYVPAIVIKLACLACLLIPFIFLFLGVTGEFNVFKPSEDIDKYSIQYDNGLENNLAEDTRTFLYQEVLLSMKARNTFFFGESATGTYTTDYFEDDVGQKKQRYGSEVGFLNTLLYSGLVGVLLFALVLFSAVYYGVVYSNNFLCKMLAVFLAFKWNMFFIEDFLEYNMNYYFLWLSVGLCLSKSFRALSDADMRAYFDFSAKKTVVKTATPVSV
ncbi:MAG: hypothetical protein ABJB86_20455 [Bacteroidota bacterium]